MGFPGKNSASKNFACNAGDPGSIPGSGRSPAGGIGCPLQYSWLPWWLRWWRIRLQCGRPGFHPWVGKIPWRREELPIPIFCLENSMYSLWGHKESDTTEWLSLSFLSDFFLNSVSLFSWFSSIKIVHGHEYCVEQMAPTLKLRKTGLKWVVCL